MDAPANWFENDTFWEGMGGVLFNGRRWEDSVAEVDDALKLLGLRPGAEVLDLACGAGRHSLELARRAFRVTGVDRTRAYVNSARQRAADEGLAVEFVLSDMRDFVRPGAFDAAVCLWASFGYFDSADDDRRVASNVLASLAPGGRFLLDLNGKETFARTFTPRSWYEQDGVKVLEEREIIDDWSKVHSRWIKVDGRSSQEYEFSIRLYSAAELTALLRDVGFEAVKIYGALSGIPYDHNARRLIAVATKAGM
jgi:SAM-dependent methyltransferase